MHLYFNRLVSIKVISEEFYRMLICKLFYTYNSYFERFFFFYQCSTQVLTHQHHEADKIVEVSNAMYSYNVSIISNVDTFSPLNQKEFELHILLFICNVCCKQGSRLSNI